MLLCEAPQDFIKPEPTEIKSAVWNGLVRRAGGRSSKNKKPHQMDGAFEIELSNVYWTMEQACVVWFAIMPEQNYFVALATACSNGLYTSLASDVYISPIFVA